MCTIWRPKSPIPANQSPTVNNTLGLNIQNMSSIAGSSHSNSDNNDEVIIFAQQHTNLLDSHNRGRVVLSIALLIQVQRWPYIRSTTSFHLIPFFTPRQSYNGRGQFCSLPPRNTPSRAAPVAPNLSSLVSPLPRMRSITKVGLLYGLFGCCSALASPSSTGSFWYSRAQAKLMMAHFRDDQRFLTLQTPPSDRVLHLSITMFAHCFETFCGFSQSSSLLWTIGQTRAKDS